MQVEIVTPTGQVYSGEAVRVTAPGALGELGILPGHQDMLAGLRVGICVVENTSHGDKSTFVVDEGYVQVTGGERVIIVTNLAESKRDVDIEKVRAELGEARSRMSETREDVDSRTWKVRKHDCDLAEARLRIAGADA
jgi:F-type H+-transporting ATPase subunit epsilon